MTESVMERLIVEGEDRVLEEKPTMTPLARIVQIRTGGDVERCHGVRHTGSYSNAQHTWGALALLYVLWTEKFPWLSPYLMFHDVPEAWVGDIPAPVKRYSATVRDAVNSLESVILKRLNLPDPEKLEKDDRAKLKACDQLDLYLWAKEQEAGGNRHASCVVRELERFFAETPLPSPADALHHEAQYSNVVHSTDYLIKDITNA